MKHRPGKSSRINVSLAIGVVAATAASAPAAAQQQQVGQQQAAPDSAQQREHVVKRGDTLWDLAQFYLSNPFLWPRIFDANRNVVEDPHWIYPNERLLIPFAQMAEAQAAVTDVAAVTDATAVAEPPLTFSPVGAPPTRTRFYRQTAAVVEDTVETEYFRADQALVPYAVTPHEFRAAPWVQDAGELAMLGRVYDLTDPATSDAELPVALRPFDRIYVSDLVGSRPAVGDTIMVVRVGKNVGGLGSAVSPRALLQVDEVASEVLIATVVHQFGPTRAGDPVIVAEEVPVMLRGEPSPVSDGVTGELVDFVADQAIHIASDQGFLDIGRQQGVSVGDELTAYYPAHYNEANGPLLPPEPIATLRVVKVRDNTSTVRVINLNTSALRPGMPVRVVRRMQ